MKQRIWELDALRGICILGVVAVHFIYDLVDMYGILHWDYPNWFAFIKSWGGVLFVLLSGLCATLGSRSMRRGLIVLGGALIVTAVTYGMYALGLAWKGIIIYFGVLHCLGVCMLLWPLFKRLPTALLALLGIAMAAAGLYLQSRYFSTPVWAIPFGFVFPGFVSADYFPLLPHLGFFLLGAVLGRTLYRKKVSLLPMLSEKTPVIGFFCFCGRQSLWIYLLHQPLLNGICYLILLFS